LTTVGPADYDGDGLGVMFDEIAGDAEDLEGKFAGGCDDLEPQAVSGFVIVYGEKLGSR
jgi:hypothetical protein